MDTNTNVSEVQRGNGDVHDFHHMTLLDPETLPGEGMLEIWSKLVKQDYAFDDFSRGNPAAFISALTEPFSVHFLAEFGYGVVRNVFEGSNGTMHFAVWDRNTPLSTVIECGTEMINYLFDVKKVHRLTGQIPSYNKLAQRFTLAQGFKFEGEMRECVLYKGQYHSVALYGLTKKDWEQRQKRGELAI